jgi:zinc D-Ala-D-Ala carboxypeptidase
VNLSAHFTLNELLRNSGEHAAPDHVLLNARHTAQVLEAVRTHLGNVPIVPTSWYRPPAKNADTLGAARNSHHMSGYGVDFNVPGMTPQEVLAALAPIVGRLRIDQIIDERDHVHLSAHPDARGQVLVEVREGVYVPWRGAGGSGPTISAAPEPGALPSPSSSPFSSIPHKPGTVLWWLAVFAVIIPVLYNIVKDWGK